MEAPIYQPFYNGTSTYTWLLDAGHGGVTPQGNYTTAPAKMHRFDDGLEIREGVINRNITNLLVALLRPRHISYRLVHDAIDDTPLSMRVARADNVFRRNRHAIYLSIHSNAGGGSGFEIFTSPGQTKSDKVAHIFCETYKKHFPHFPFRQDHSDGDADKEADFYVLRKTDCPALLVENLFFDNRNEAEYLLSTAGQTAIANCLLEAISTTEHLKPF